MSLSDKEQGSFADIDRLRNEDLSMWFLKEDVKECFDKILKRMEKKLILNKIKYSDVVLIIKEEAGPKLIPTLCGMEVKIDNNLKKNEVELRG